MKFKNIFVLFISVVIALEIFSGCSMNTDNIKDSDISMAGIPSYVIKLKKAIEKQGYQVNVRDFNGEMYDLICCKDESLYGTRIVFMDQKIKAITYVYEITDPKEIEANIQGFKDYVTEYSEMLDRASADTSLDQWPVSEVLSDPAYFEFYKKDTEKSSYATNGHYELSFYIAKEEYPATMDLRINGNIEPYELQQGFYEEALDSDNEQNRAYGQFKEKMNMALGETYSTGSISFPGSCHVFTVYSADNPCNSVEFEVSNDETDATINEVTYIYEIKDEISDDSILEEISTFISDITAKVLQSGYDIPELTADLDENILEQYYENKDESYELVLEDGRVVFSYFAEGYHYSSPEVTVRILSDTQSSSDSEEPAAVVEFKKDIEKQGYLAYSESFDGVYWQVRCWKDENYTENESVEVVFNKEVVDSIYYVYHISDNREIDTNIRNFKNYITEYSEFLDKASEDTSLEKWPVSGIFDDPKYFELYRENTMKASYAGNDYYEVRFIPGYESREADMTLMLHGNVTPCEIYNGFSDTGNGKAESYDEFKETMYDVFEEGYKTDTVSSEDGLNVLTVVPLDSPENKMLFNVSDDGTVHSISYEYRLTDEISDDKLPEEINTFISDMNFKAIDPGYNMPLILSDLEEKLFEKYSEDKSKAYELEFDSGRAVFTYLPKTEEQSYPMFVIKGIKN